MSMPAVRAAAVSASRVHTAGPASSAATSSPALSRTPRPGGGPATRAISWERWAWLIRGLRPTPGRSPSPSSPSAAKRANRWRTAFGLQPSAWAMAGTRSPSQDNEMICARRIQSAGACRAPASLRILRSSPASAGGRANSSQMDHIRAEVERQAAAPAPAVAPLALADRCDASAVVGGPNGRTSRGACGAQGFIRAVLPSGNDLIFCAHHGREQEAALAAAGATIHDETGKIDAEHSPRRRLVEMPDVGTLRRAPVRDKGDPVVAARRDGWAAVGSSSGRHAR
jgi:hypothetical protein